MERLTPALCDKQGKITKKGAVIHELVLKDVLLRQAADPDCSFAMAPELLTDYQGRRDELLKALKVPKEPVSRDEQLATWSRGLEEKGYPYWRKLTTYSPVAQR